MENKYYPKDVYCIREDVTRENKRRYDKMKEKWYSIAEQMYPGYWKMSFRDRMAVQEKINEKAGYRI